MPGQLVAVSPVSGTPSVSAVRESGRERAPAAERGDAGRTWPAVSQICSLIVLPSSWMVRIF